MNIPDFHPEKYDYTAYIVGGGTSLKDFDWALLDSPDKFVIAINSAYMRLPNAQILYCTDPPWIKQHEKDLKEFKGIIYQGVLNPNKPPKMDVVDMQWHLTGPTGLETKKGSLKHGSNSPYAALNMAAVHLGFKKIYLLGLDMKWGTKGKKHTSHWHSKERPHQRIDGEAIYTKMRLNYKTIVKPLKSRGIEVINVNTPDGTDLEAFPIKSVEEVFGLEPKPKKVKKEKVINVTQPPPTIKGYVGAVAQIPESMEVAKRCIETGKKFGVDVELVEAIYKDDALNELEKWNLNLSKWDESYSNVGSVVGNFITQYIIWRKIFKSGEPGIVLEHDAVFVADIPDLKGKGDIINLGKPSYGQFRKQNKAGVYPMFSKNGGYIPGAHAYYLTPQGAKQLIKAAQRMGAAPCDLFLCKKNFPEIKEYYPWPIEAHDEFTTIQKEKGCKAKHNYSDKFKVL